MSRTNRDSFISSYLIYIFKLPFFALCHRLELLTLWIRVMLVGILVYAQPYGKAFSLLPLNIISSVDFLWASLVAQTVKTPPAMRETWVWSLGWEDPLEEVMETHSSVLAWRIPMDRGALRATLHEVTKNQIRCSLSCWRSSPLFKSCWCFFFLPWTNIELCQMPFCINQYVFFLTYYGVDYTDRFLEYWINFAFMD